MTAYIREEVFSKGKKRLQGPEAIHTMYETTRVLLKNPLFRFTSQFPQNVEYPT
jgi:hypothetical protein